MHALRFALTRASDGAPVDAAAYRGRVVLLYFGYTHCPDLCPATLANLADAIAKLGARADGVRVLFVSVDPKRDTAAALAAYVRAFSAEIQGFRRHDDELAEVARGCRADVSA